MQSPPTAPRVQCISLACRLIHEHFGRLPAVVVEVLLRKGRQTFAELLRSINASNRSTRQLHLGASSGSSGDQQGSTLTSSQLKQVLLVLMQQNCITCCLQPAEVLVTGIRPAVTIYEADLSQMLQLIRRPKFVQHIRDASAANPNRTSEADALIVEVLLEHGRLRYDQIVQAVVARTSQQAPVKSEPGPNPTAAPEGGDARPDALTGSEPGQAVWWAFLQLLQERFIERTPPCNLPPLPPKSAAPSRAKKTAPKPGTAEYVEAQLKAAQLQQHKDYEDTRFRAPSDLAPAGLVMPADAGAAAADDDDDDDAAVAAAAAAAAATAATQQTRKRRKTAGGITADDAAAAAAAEAAAAAADTAAAARQAAALAARKKRKTNTGAGKAVALAEGDCAAAADGLAVKLEPGADAAQKPSSPAARKHKAAPAAAAATAVEPPSAHEILWRVNTEEFNRRFRNEALVGIVTEKLGQDAGTVLAAMLAQARRAETGLSTEYSIPMSIGDVTSSLAAAQDSGHLPQLRDDTTVADQLKALAWDSLNCVDVGAVGPGGDTYIVNIANLLDRIKLQHISRVLMDKFGVIGMRVFNTLLLHGQLEPKQIADFVMREQKEARELLYRMFKAGYLQMQDIPKSAERAPSRCFYTFKADTASTCSRLIADMFRAADNLHARLTHELSRHVELLELVEAAQAAGHLVFNMTSDQRKSLERLHKVTNALHLSLLQLDGTLALFNEYCNWT